MPFLGQEWEDMWRVFSTGFTASAVSKSAVAPLDRVKLILQTQQCNYALNAGEVERYTGVTNCMRRLASEQGVLSLWRGNQAEVMRYAPVHAFNFLFRDMFSLVTPADAENMSTGMRAGVNFMEGAMAGTATLLLVQPFDVMRTRLATDVGTGYTRQYRGVTDCMVKTLKMGGPTAFYSGFYVSIPAVFVYRGVYLGGWTTAKELVQPESFALKFALAQAVTTAASLAAYPLDTVRRRVMLQHGSRERLYATGRDCLRRMMQDEGPRAFYAGAGANIFRGTGGALVLMLYDHLTNANKVR